MTANGRLSMAAFLGRLPALLKARRGELRLRDVQERCDVPFQMLHKYEGGALPASDNLAKLCGWLGVTVNLPADATEKPVPRRLYGLPLVGLGSRETLGEESSEGNDLRATVKIAFEPGGGTSISLSLSWGDRGPVFRDRLSRAGAIALAEALIEEARAETTDDAERSIAA